MLMLVLFLLMIMSLSPTQEMSMKKPLVSESYEEFGIVTQEDIYPDTIDLRLYTSHGRVKFDKLCNKIR
jgi:hypothetical protein